ncbi:hypothetical protein AYI69_g6834, partial [Smittium culicis]
MHSTNLLNKTLRVVLPD